MVLRSRVGRLVVSAFVGCLPLLASLPAQAAAAPVKGPHHDHARGQGAASTTTTAGTLQLQSGGGPVLTSPSVYLSFWGTPNSGARSYLESFFGAVGGSGWANVATQYCSNAPVGATSCGAGSVFAGNPASQWKGSWVDTTPVPASPNDLDIQNAALRAVSQFGYHPGAMYFVMTPSGHSESGFGTSWCAWHASTVSGGSQVPYTYLPYQPDAGASCGVNAVNPTDSFGHGIFDGFSIVGGHEFMESITDPFPNSGWIDANGQENGDKCQWSAGPVGNYTFGGTFYAVQPTWSNASAACAMSSSTPPPPPSPVTGLYSVDAFGGVHALGSSTPYSGTAYWSGWDIARGIATFKDGSGGYVLDGFGGLHQFGNAPPPAPGYAYWSGWDIARDIVLAPWATASNPQGWVMDGWGGFHAFNGAPVINGTGYWPGWEIAHGFVVAPDSTPTQVRGYTLDGFGGLHPFVGSPGVSQSSYWPGWNIARGVVWSAGASGSNPGGYVIDGYGGLHQFGSAPAAVSGTAYWGGQDLTRGATAWSGAAAGSPGGWVLRADGGVYSYGSAPAVAGVFFGTPLARSIAGG